MSDDLAMGRILDQSCHRLDSLQVTSGAADA